MRSYPQLFEIPILIAMVVGVLIMTATPARAHCDTEAGPVVSDAKAALASGDVTPVLKWVRPADESEIRAAFATTLAVRRDGDASRELADTWFFETLVRVHRAGEGAPYTGLKPAGTPLDPVVDRILDDHRATRKLVRSGGHDPQRLAEFGERLTGHVRFEERVAFPSAETKLASDVLEGVEKAATPPSAERPTSRKPRQ